MEDSKSNNESAIFSTPAKLVPNFLASEAAAAIAFGDFAKVSTTALDAFPTSSIMSFRENIVLFCLLKVESCLPNSLFVCFALLPVKEDIDTNWAAAAPDI